MDEEEEKIEDGLPMDIDDGEPLDIPESLNSDFGLDDEDPDNRYH